MKAFLQFSLFTFFHLFLIFNLLSHLWHSHYQLLLSCQRRLSSEWCCSRSALVAHSVFIVRLVSRVLCSRAQCSFTAVRSFVAQCLVLSAHSVFDTLISDLIQCSSWSYSTLLHMSGRDAQTAKCMSRSQDVTIAPIKTEPKSKRFSLIDKEVSQNWILKLYHLTPTM